MMKFDANLIGFILLLGVVGGLYRFAHEPAIRSLPYVASVTSSSAEASPFSLLEEPRALPELHFFDGNGVSLTLAAFHGKTVLLNIWATWCVPCRKEIPTLGRFQAKLGGEGFEVVALSVDQGGAATVRAFYNEIGIHSLSVYVDPSGYAVRDLNLVGIPTTLLIDRDGRELARAVGPAEWDSPGSIETIRRYLSDVPRVSDASGDGSSTTADDLRRRQRS